METLVQFLLRHGYAVLFASVLVEQMGLPVPAVPVLLAQDAMPGLDKISLGVQFAALFATQDRRDGMTSFIENGPGKAEFTGR